MNNRWIIRDPDPLLQVRLSNTLGVHPIVAQLLINRNLRTIEEARDFLNADISCLCDPYLLADMEIAIARIEQAKSHHELILIYGDYYKSVVF